MAAGQLMDGTTRPLLNTDGSGGHRPEVVAVSSGGYERANREATLLATGIRSADIASADQVNDHGRGVTVWISVSSIVATPSIIVSIQRKDPISGTYSDILASAAITAVGNIVLRLYPGIAAVANQAASDILPRTWRVYVSHADADQISYSVAACVEV